MPDYLFSKQTKFKNLELGQIENRTKMFLQKFLRI